ncbi:MAG: O-sialoglycoprotein endopeptidase, partial [Eubacteriales bacterium]|nr:O-sialoglycoprotein endopeptidase [Eubacteriales bacterium]
VALGFDTSCYTTSVAAVSELGGVIGSQRMLLPVPQGQRGLRQSEAVFAHVRQMPQVLEALALPDDCRVVAVAASARPRDEEESYMPVFTVGLGHAKAIAKVLGVPCCEVSHQQGHIAAGCLGNPPMDDRFVALHLSGGTTELLLSDQGRLTLLGVSVDLHAGQLVDRVGVALGLPFPAGPNLERLAEGATAAALLPACMESGDLRCHLSGAETRCQQWIREAAYPGERVAAEVYDLLARTVARLLTAGCASSGVHQALVVGGVASSARLRRELDVRLRKLHAPIEVRFGRPEYSADNAAGVAALAMKTFQGGSL